MAAICCWLLVGCGAAASSQPPTGVASIAPSALPSTARVEPVDRPIGVNPTGAADALHLVVIGDSIGHADFCPECTGWVELYAKQLEASLGRPVVVANRSRNDSAGIPQIKQQVADDESLRKEIAEADVVVVSVGFNSAMPDASLGTGCTGDMGTTDASYADWLLTTDDACVQAGIDAWAPDYDEIFTTIAGLRPGEPTLRVALNVYDGNIDWIQNADVPSDRVPKVERFLTTLYDRFNPMLCDRAKAAGVHVPRHLPRLQRDG